MQSATETTAALGRCGKRFFLPRQVIQSTFAPSITTITLTNGELVIDKNLIITGPGANRLTVTARCIDFVSFRIFNISSEVTVSISGITISNGVASDGPGGGGF